MNFWRKLFPYLSIVKLVHQLLDEVAGEGDEEGVADDSQLGEDFHDGEPDAWFGEQWSGL